MAELRRALSGVPAVADVRGLGLLLGIELTGGRDHAPAQGAAVRVARSALKEGLLVLPSGAHGHVVGLTPAVELNDDQMRYAVRVLARTIREATL